MIVREFPLYNFNNLYIELTILSLGIKYFNYAPCVKTRNKFVREKSNTHNLLLSAKDIKA